MTFHRVPAKNHIKHQKINFSQMINVEWDRKKCKMFDSFEVFRWWTKHQTQSLRARKKNDRHINFIFVLTISDGFYVSLMSYETRFKFLNFRLDAFWHGMKCNLSCLAKYFVKALVHCSLIPVCLTLILSLLDTLLALAKLQSINIKFITKREKKESKSTSNTFWDNENF